MSTARIGMTGICVVIKVGAATRELAGRTAELGNCLIQNHLPSHATIEPGGRKACA